MLALARKLVNGNEDDAADTVEAVFAQARAVESESEECLVDEGWQPTEIAAPNIVEIHTETGVQGLEAAATHGNGHDPTVVRPGVEFAPDIGLVAVNGNAHSPEREAEATESQRSLFSCAEFMSEPPANRRGSARNLQPSRSLFEWAVAMEQTHEAEKDEAALPA